MHYIISDVQAKIGEGMKMEKVPWYVGQGWGCCEGWLEYEGKG